MFIFLDESGDLGFDWSKAKTSRYFTITLLVCDSTQVADAFRVAVRRTLRNKLNHKKSTRRVKELKGSATSLEVKRYFSRQMPEHGWGLYSVTLNKSRVYPDLQSKAGKKKLYNFLARFLIEKLPLTSAPQGVHLVLDRCKNKEEIQDFNGYIANHLQGILPLETPLYISHESSQNNPCLQAVDVFCWGIARQRSHKDDSWFKEFSGAVRCNETYLR